MPRIITTKREVEVLLSRRGIKYTCCRKTKQPSKKLDYTKLGPFKVKAVKRLLNYELELLPQMKIHPVFHVMYLEPANNNTPLETNPPKIDPDNQEIKYEVEAILDQQEVDGQPRYLIK